MVWEIMDLLGCSYDKNQVGLFVWAKVSDSIEDVKAWIDEIMLGAEVFITPGFIFGSNGARYIRISLCSDPSDFEESISRIQAFLEK